MTPSKIMIAIAGGMLLLCGRARAVITIHEIQLQHYVIPRTTPFVTSKGKSDACYGIFITINADDGAGHTIQGLGDALPRGTVTNETYKDAWAGAQVMAAALENKQLEGKDATADVATIRGWLDNLRGIANAQKLTTTKPPLPGKQLDATLCGFDIALLDLVGKIHNCPIAVLLGGIKRPVVTVSAMTFNADLSLDDLDEKVDSASGSFGSMRLKVGLDDQQDIEKLSHVAQDLHDKPQVSIWVDANHAWASADKSIEMLGKIRDALTTAGFKSTFICEQPTEEHDLEGLAKVTSTIHSWLPTMPFKIVIMADEAMWNLEDAKKIVALHACDLVNIKIQKAGGLLASMDIGNYLHEKAPEMGVYVGGVVATDVTSWANLQLCCALPRLDYATGCIPRRAYKVNVAATPIEYEKDKNIRLPSTPGLGTTLNADLLKGYVKDVASVATTQPAQ